MATRMSGRRAMPPIPISDRSSTALSPPPFIFQDVCGTALMRAFCRQRPARWRLLPSGSEAPVVCRQLWDQARRQMSSRAFIAKVVVALGVQQTAARVTQACARHFPLMRKLACEHSAIWVSMPKAPARGARARYAISGNLFGTLSLRGGGA